MLLWGLRALLPLSGGRNAQLRRFPCRAWFAPKLAEQKIFMGLVEPLVHSIHDTSPTEDYWTFALLFTSWLSMFTVGLNIMGM